MVVTVNTDENNSAPRDGIYRDDDGNLGSRGGARRANLQPISKEAGVMPACGGYDSLIMVM